MRHRPASPPLRRRLFGLVRQQTGRLLLGAAVILTVTALMLTIPVVSGGNERTSTVALESSSSAAAPAATDPAKGSSPVQLGVDGAPPRSGAPDTTGASSADSPMATTAGGSATGPASGSSSSPVGSTPASSGVPTAAGTSSSNSSPTSSSPSSGSTSSSSSSSSSSAATLAGTGSPSAPQTTSDAPAAPAPPDGVSQVVALVNAQRAAAGCGALAVDDALTAKAQAHSAAMRDRDYFALTGPVDGSVLDQGARAAAIARGSSDPATVVAGWLADSADSAALLDCSLTTVGVGTADGAGGPWWTALLA